MKEAGNKFIAESYIVTKEKTIYVENDISYIKKEMNSKKSDVIRVDLALIVTEKNISINKKDIKEYGRVTKR